MPSNVEFLLQYGIKYENEKTSVAKKQLYLNCINTTQAKMILTLFSHDREKIEVLKYKFRNASIEELELPVRAYNCLKREQINTIADLFKYSPEELLKLKNFGRVSAFKLYTALKEQFGIIWVGLT